LLTLSTEGTDFLTIFFRYVHVLPDEYVDMVKAGIIDPLKVIRTALVDAAR
jgi:hypothetical protein